MRKTFFPWLYFVCLLANPLVAASNLCAAERLVTPTSQTERVGGEGRLEAPANARPPVDIDVGDLKPTLLAPIVSILERVLERQDATFDELDKLSAYKPNDRTDEILAAVRGIDGREIRIKGWDDNAKKLAGLSEAFIVWRDKLNEQLETLAKQSDLVEAVSAMTPEPVDLSEVAKEETLIALDGRVASKQDVAALQSAVVELSAQFNALLEQIPGEDIQGDVSTLKNQLKVANICLIILLCLFAVQAAITVWGWLVSIGKAAKAKAAATAEKMALLDKLLQREKEKSAEETGRQS